MKLDSAKRQKVEEQLSMKAVSEDHPSAPELKDALGDHTFFLDEKGLNIVEPSTRSESSDGNLVKVASWTEGRTALRVHEPQAQPVTVDLKMDETDPAA